MPNLLYTGGILVVHCASLFGCSTSQSANNDTAGPTLHCTGTLLLGMLRSVNHGRRFLSALEKTNAHICGASARESGVGLEAGAFCGPAKQMRCESFLKYPFFSEVHVCLGS